MASSIVMHFEGVRYEAYLDPVGVPTICWGHTAGVVMGQVKTASECLQLLYDDLTAAIKTVDSLAKEPLPVERRAGLASFVFNVGASKFAGSTLLRKLNGDDVVGACVQLDRWVYAGGVMLSGLVFRRAEEREFCEVGL